ncbi:MAG: serine/threonine-protein kinase [Victivallis sp.]
MPLECVQIPPGTILAGYRVESELGRGNNGVVYLAEQQSLGRQVAFKILLPELAAEPGYVESFLREARLAARLDHPYIVQAYDAGATPEGYYYFAMELVIGPSLEDVRRDSPELLTFELIFRLSIELAEALDYAWTVHKMTHGDIKPGNLLISEETGELKLTDLGLARVSGSNTGDDIMATPLYAAPEVIRGETADVGVRSDLYSFGIMLYELLCGSPPFVGSPQKVLEQHLFSLPRPLAERNPDLDPALVAFVEKLIDKNPANRPASWLEVRDFLATLLEGLQNRPPVTLRELEPPELRRKRHRRVFLFWFGGILLAAGLAAAVLLALRMMRFEPTPLELPPEPAATELPPQEEAEKEEGAGTGGPFLFSGGGDTAGEQTGRSDSGIPDRLRARPGGRRRPETGSAGRGLPCAGKKRYRADGRLHGGTAHPPGPAAARLPELRPAGQRACPAAAEPAHGQTAVKLRQPPERRVDQRGGGGHHGKLPADDAA